MNPTTDTHRHPRRKRRWVRLSLWATAIVLALALGAAALVYSALDRQLRAPEWLHQRIEARVAQLLPGVDIRFGAVSMVVSSGWRPRVRLRDVELSQPDGPVFLTLSDLETGLAMKPLLRGRFQLGRVRLSGAAVNVRRRADGSFDLSFGTALPAVEKAVSVPQLIEELDKLMLSPQLIALRQVDAEALTINYEDMRAERAWTVDGGRVRLVRAGDDLRISGDLALLGGYDYVSTMAVNFESRIGSPAAQFGMNFEDMAARDIADQTAALAWLHALRAPISGALRASIDEAGNFGPMSGTLQIAQGALQPTDQTTPVPFDAARAYFTYLPATQTLQFDELSVTSKWISARIEGQALLLGMKNGWPSEMLGQFRMSGVTANPAGMFPQPVKFDAATMDIRLGLEPFVLTLGQMTLSEAGQVLVLDGSLKAEPEGWQAALNGQMERIDPELVLSLWPEAMKEKTRKWITENLHSARLSKGQLAFRKAPTEPAETYLGFQFDEASATFVKTLPPITGGSGHASLMGTRFVVTADRGKVQAAQGGAVDISGTSLIIPDVRIKDTPAEVRLRTSGTITASLALLDAPPLNLLSKAGRPVTLADGRADAKGVLKLRLKKKLPPEEVEFAVTAQLSGVRSDKIVPGRVLSAARLAVTASNDALQIAGKGRIGQVPFDAAYDTSLKKADQGKARVAGTVELSQGFIDEFGIGLPPRTVSGAGTGAFELNLVRDQPIQFRLGTDLAGLGLSQPDIGWSLSRRSKGRLEVAGALGAPPVIDGLSLVAPGLSATGALKIGADGQLSRATFSRVKAGGWLDAPVTLIGRGKGVAPAVQISGGRIDLRQTAVGGGGGGGGGGGPVSLSLERLQITDGISLSGFKGEFTTKGGMDGRFTGRVNGSAPITGVIKPSGGRSAFEIRSDDAGAVFSAAGLLKKAHKGALVLTLKPVGEAGSFDGRLKVGNVWLRDAPAMAELLNAVSVIGLLEQLGGRGILFSEVDAKFRLTPDQVIVRKSSAIGASIGISMDGIYDLNSGAMDMQGTFSPIYLLNGIGSILTRKGEGLLGFSYRLRGTAENPKVQVNPLSIFTPGMFRDIFRRPAPKVSQ
ncbi:DUF3971 domain-containing protein [Thalassovita taeanensis]|uniref:AsmA-like C-terminal region n=1 Tax=Thalassovita taeanensis TaxID=657014 RepID=A0A1H8YTV5_9RHOB|nr:DUF3971 domain-containing protein [Thalassovita taeanensis]SEP55576.1 AsmA-like C-terminal region [Thalassovita taeanensis]